MLNIESGSYPLILVNNILLLISLALFPNSKLLFDVRLLAKISLIFVEFWTCKPLLPNTLN